MVMERTRPPTSGQVAVLAARRRNAAILASARRLDVRRPDDLSWLKKQRQQWQTQAWMFNDTVPEVNFAHRYLANVLSRLRIFPAWRPDPNAAPVPMDPDIPPEGEDPAYWQALASTAQLELARLAGSDGSYGAVLGPMAWNIGLVGECFLVALPDEDSLNGETFDVLSIDELHIVDENRGEVRIRKHDGDNEGELLAPDTMFCRIWRRHPRWRSYADAPMASLISTCADLMLLSRAIRASAESRLNAGIFTVPSEMLFDEVEQPDDGDGQSRKDPFMADLEAAMLEPIADPDHPSSRVPLLVRAGRDDLAALRHLTLDRPIDERAAEEREELRNRLATGLDIPNEILLGMADANHWTAWQIDEQTFKAHLEPLAVLMTAGIYRGFLRPALAAQEFVTDKVTIGYDASDLIGDENEFDRAAVMHEQRVVGHAFLRRAGGASEDDQPSEEELENWPVQNPFSPAPAPRADTDAPEQEDEEPVPLVAAAVARPKPSADLDRLAARLLDIDRTLRLRISEKADHAVQRALEIAGSKLRRKLQNRDAALAREFATTIRPAEFPAAVGTKRMLAFDIQPEQLIDDDAFLELTAAFTALSLRAYRQTVAAVYREMRRDLTADAIDSFEKDAARNIAAGADRLQQAVRQTFTERLTAPAGVAPARGEFDGLAFVRPGQVRESISIAGGAVSVEPDTITGTPSGGIATGDATQDLLETTFGVTAEGGRWLYGDPASRSRPLEAHEALDGVEFGSWDDDVLANQDSWPEFDFFFPGDHSGCQCDYLPKLEMGT